MLQAYWQRMKVSVPPHHQHFYLSFFTLAILVAVSIFSSTQITHVNLSRINYSSQDSKHSILKILILGLFISTVMDAFLTCGVLKSTINTSLISGNQNDCQLFFLSKKRNSLILASLKRSHSNYFKLTLGKNINHNNNLWRAIKLSFF